ncbi:hypothetical protein [Methylotenera versatilis]|jgi:hypothetical protein|uniref:Putative transmembrane protein n=1 Tax=Methylotenera versatilis (strain 301) TaxID=666681 RepID=D7DPI6_METV0|nr:hypothetical protein [Methylotenera versatilis]ADI29230.1 putative transmembrane protein [Methylotenera versatilis 301]
MNRRLYFVLPDVVSAHGMFDDLLLARVNANHIHFLANESTKLGDLPAATISERSDLIEGWEIGMGLGALLGLILGLVALAVPVWWYTQPLPTFATLAICTLVGFMGGGFWTAVVATTIPNVRLKPFEKQISRGKVLMMVLVPFHRINEIRELVIKKHPEAAYSGTWPTDHVMFP